MESTKELLFYICSSLGQAAAHVVGMVIWSLWKSRNNCIWEGVVESYFDVVRRASECWEQWNALQVDQRVLIITLAHEVEAKWSRPPDGFLKINVDVAGHSNLNLSSFGLCIRDHIGSFQMARMAWLTPAMEPHLAKVMALHAALVWALKLELDSLVFEIDCRLIVNALNNSQPDMFEFGSVSIAFVRRGANVVSHALAKLATLGPPFHDSEVVPHCIAAVVTNEMI